MSNYFRVKIQMKEPVNVVPYGIVTEFRHHGKVLPMWYLEQNWGLRVTSAEEDGKSYIVVETGKWYNIVHHFPHIIWKLSNEGLEDEMIQFFEVTPSGHYRMLYLVDNMLFDYNVGPWIY